MDGTYVEHTRISIRYASLIRNNHLKLPRMRDLSALIPSKLPPCEARLKKLTCTSGDMRKEFLHTISITRIRQHIDSCQRSITYKICWQYSRRRYRARAASRVPKSAKSFIMLSNFRPRDRACRLRTKSGHARMRGRFYARRALERSENTPRPARVFLRDVARTRDQGLWFFRESSRPRRSRALSGPRATVAENTRRDLRCCGTVVAHQRARRFFSLDARYRPVKRKCRTTRRRCAAAWKTTTDNNGTQTRPR